MDHREWKHEAKEFVPGQIVALPWTRPFVYGTVKKIGEPWPSGMRVVYVISDEGEEVEVPDDVLSMDPSVWDPVEEGRDHPDDLVKRLRRMETTLAMPAIDGGCLTPEEGATLTDAADEIVTLRSALSGARADRDEAKESANHWYLMWHRLDGIDDPEVPYPEVLE